MCIKKSGEGMLFISGNSLWRCFLLKKEIYFKSNIACHFFLNIKLNCTQSDKIQLPFALLNIFTSGKGENKLSEIPCNICLSNHPMLLSNRFYTVRKTPAIESLFSKVAVSLNFVKIYGTACSYLKNKL